MKLTLSSGFAALCFFSDTVDAARLHGRLRTNRTQATMSELFSFYHTTDKINEELQSLVADCPAMSMRTVQGTSGSGAQRSINVITIKKPDAQPVNKNFLLFGEHARELISPESGLHFVKTLCGKTDLSAQAQDVLADSEFQIVVNGNPESRQKVEQGDFCLRADPEGVDLNRNWDEHWQAEQTMYAGTNPGPSPFSEAETRIFKDLVSEYKPTTFLTIHSGTKGMYMPWAYDMHHLADRNQPQMMQILKALDKDHCQCPFGAAGREVGYSCPGTCLDWVYEHMQAQYAFAFEIFVGSGEDELRQRWEEKMADEGALIQQSSHLAHDHFKDFFEKHPSCFVQLKSRSSRRSEDKSQFDCFTQFNPHTEDDYKRTVDNWSETYLQMAQMVVNNIKNGGSAKSVQVPM